LLFFVLAQLLFLVVADGWFPQMYDPEYDARLSRLRARLAEQPDRPLLLMLGSSRTVMCFRPEILSLLRTDSGQPVLPFNFSHYGGNQAIQLMKLHRLLRQGIRPRWVVLELMLPMLSEDSPAVAMNGASALDLPVARRYMPNDRLFGVFLRNRSLPLYLRRSHLLHAFAPGWVEPGNRLERDQIKLDPLGGDTGWMVPREVTPESVRRFTDCTRARYFAELQRFHIKDRPQRAVRDLLRLCRREGIGVVLLLTPESSEYRGWYPPSADAEIGQYCAGLRRDFGVPVVDARDWLADGDFLDGHHTLQRGADAFTRRLEREVLRPLVAGSTLGD
jgi:hypothetical protein